MNEEWLNEGRKKKGQNRKQWKKWKLINEWKRVYEWKKEGNKALMNERNNKIMK